MGGKVKTHRDPKVLLAVLGLAIVLAWGCSPEQTPTGPESGTPEIGALAVEFTAYATPAQSPLQQAYDAVYITFESVRVYPVTTECDSSGPHGPGGPGSGGDGAHHGECTYIEIMTDPLTVNVMDLDDTLTVLLGTCSLPAGPYSHLQLGISAAWVETAGGETIALALPGRSDPSLKIIDPFVVEDGQVTGISIVIDLAQSIHEVRPGSGNLVLRPVFWSEEHLGHHGGSDPGHGPGLPGGYHGE